MSVFNGNCLTPKAKEFNLGIFSLAKLTIFLLLLVFIHMLKNKQEGIYSKYYVQYLLTIPES